MDADPDPLAQRLRDLGRLPVDAATSSRHLQAMARVGRSTGRLRGRLKIGLAFAAGLLIGGTGLASAGALPGPAQDAARTTLSKVGVKVPQGTERFNDPAVCGTDRATGQPFKNHGQYVKAHKGDPAAAQSMCGKPLKAGQKADSKPAEKPSDPTAGKPDDGDGGKGNSGNGRGKDKVKDPKVKDPKVMDDGETEPKKEAPVAPTSTNTKTSPPGSKESKEARPTR